MVSIRHQAWAIKVNYNDGAGDGSIIWKLGYQGDFALQSGTTSAVDPVDRFYAQHDSNRHRTETELHARRNRQSSFPLAACN